MKKGFTLIELLAVIIVLAIIALIATPSIINVINSAKDKSDLESVHGILDSARLYYSESMLNSDLRSDIENLNNIYEKVSLSIKEKTGELYINEKGLSAIAIVIRNKCYTKQFTGDIKITENIDNCTLGYVGIDTTAPTVTFNVEDGVFNSNGWAKSNFNVNITISDSESGPNSYKYCIDNKNCEPEVLVNNTTGFSEISNNSETNKVCVIGIDNYGNESDIICSNNYRLDLVVPILTEISGDITVIKGESHLSSSYFNNPIYGISNGSLICNPNNTNELSIGTQTISCTATSNSGLSKTTNKTITVETNEYTWNKYSVIKQFSVNYTEEVGTFSDTLTATVINDEDYYWRVAQMTGFPISDRVKFIVLQNGNLRVNYANEFAYTFNPSPSISSYVSADIAKIMAPNAGATGNSYQSIVVNADGVATGIGWPRLYVPDYYSCSKLPYAGNYPIGTSQTFTCTITYLGYYSSTLTSSAKGSISYGTITTNSPNSYPADGMSGDYWYVKQ